jgi:hypothetical protein
MAPQRAWPEGSSENRAGMRLSPTSDFQASFFGEGAEVGKPRLRIESIGPVNVVILSFLFRVPQAQRIHIHSCQIPPNGTPG